MKRKFFSVICTVIAMLMTCTVFLAGCFGSGNNTPEDTTPKEYTIQYTDDSGTHQITVAAGMPYALDVVPEKTGYTFAGLFDAEVGGTQYISSTGASLSPFTDGKNMVLFPQFKAKDYTVILDYQGAAVTGVRQLTVAYGSSLPELPKNLTGEHKEFAGWYTKANCEGTQIADEYGLVPVVSVLNDTNFDLSGEYVYLYAGFEIEKFTVTCCFEAGMDTEDLQVEYGTPANQIVPKTRVDGKAPLTWSKTQGGEVWNGKVEGDMVLYAVEYAPVIELDSNGGNKVNSLVARAGSTIALPTPTKDMAKFAYWEDMQGNKYTSTTMPSKSISLKAVWQAKLVIDENGGSDVDDISVAAGNKITLPTPEREGFIFAGWYTAEKEQYTSTIMPSAGIKLKAGWYKTKQVKLVIKSSDESPASTGSIGSSTVKGPSADWRKVIDLSEYIPENGANIRLSIHYEMKLYDNTDKGRGGFYLYDNPDVSDAYCLHKYTAAVYDDAWANYDYVADINMSNNKLYMCYVGWLTEWHYNIGSYWGGIYYQNIWADMQYPDTTNLYL